MKRPLRHAAAMLLALAPSPTITAALAQDVAGLELCTAEKQMERRTGCLQSNDDFLHQQLTKFVRETNAKITASDRALAAARTEIAALKASVDKLNGEVAQLRSGKLEPKK